MKTLTCTDKLLTLVDASAQKWDAVILGGGMGGCGAAYNLAKQGHKVLLVEKGLANFKKNKTDNVVVEIENPIELINSGRWPTKVAGIVDGKKLDLWAPLGCGVGGSTLLYGAALQRLKPIDFEEQAFPDGKISWPFSYEDLEPYYQECEKLFGVRGTEDPLDLGENIDLLPPPAMCERDQAVFMDFKTSGLNPYRIHVGIEYKQHCGECGGKICGSGCKKDGHNGFILPALDSGNLYITDETEILKLNADNSKVTSAEAVQKSEHHTLTAKIFVLAAGGYFSPAVLQQSTNDHWPQGLANSSGLVGKNLMFHVSDFIALWPRNKHLSKAGAKKTIALRDFYINESEKLGEFQSIGRTAGYGNILYALRLLFDQSIFRRIPLVRQFLRIPAYIAAKVLGEATIFATIVEDFPHLENQIVLDKNSPSGVRFEYNIKDELKRRAMKLKTLVRKKVKSLRSIPISVGTTLNYGHPCGTCKAGLDPSTSVLDQNCKAHDLENLYITDSSFMPTSGGTNPSLTIAANALRVADKISQHLQTL